MQVQLTPSCKSTRYVMFEYKEQGNKKDGTAMSVSVHLIILFIWVQQDHVCSAIDYKMVKLGGNLRLECTYNCSSGFVQGSWRTESDISACNTTKSNGNICTVSICLSNVSSRDVKRNYSCYTVDTDDPNLTKKTVRIVFLRLRAQDAVLNWTSDPNIDLKNRSFSVEPGISSRGEFNGIKVLAAVTVTVATVLVVLVIFLCVNRNKPIWHGKGERLVSRSCSPQSANAGLLQVKGTLSTQCERITLRIPPPDIEGDTEVPYADIMITVRGVSTPELTQIGYLGTGKWRGDETRCHMQASRSADRLHVPQPREVSRKMSTNSEYAVITYS